MEEGTEGSLDSHTRLIDINRSIVTALFDAITERETVVDVVRRVVNKSESQVGGTLDGSVAVRGTSSSAIEDNFVVRG